MIVLPNGEGMRWSRYSAGRDCRAPYGCKWSLLFWLLRLRCLPGLPIMRRPWTSRYKRQAAFHLEEKPEPESCERTCDRLQDRCNGFRSANIIQEESSAMTGK